MPMFIGIDVGAQRKGYHAVAIDGRGGIERYQSCVAAEMARWCVSRAPEIIAIDSPCRWRLEGHPARLAERELAADRISCFSTPTELRAQGHSFYTWMFAGQELYHALGANYPIYTGVTPNGPVCIETFPQAVACALAGGIVSAKSKTRVRRELLLRAGIDASLFENMDEVDAALCAYTAHRFAERDFKAYGDAVGGFIIVPATPLAAPRPDASADQALATIVSLLPSLTSSERDRLRAALTAVDSGYEHQ